MNLSEIENLTFDELKARREELQKVAADAPRTDLAARYVQARADAKQRDEALARQGRTLTALHQGLDAATGRAAELSGQLEQKTSQLEQATAELNQLKESLRSTEAAAAVTLALARKRRTVLAELVNLITPLLADG